MSPKLFRFALSAILVAASLLVASKANAFDSNPFPNISGLQARFLPSGLSANGLTWVSTTGGDTATITGTALIKVNSNGVNGASASFQVVQGETSSVVSWQSSFMANNAYTFFNITRYNSNNTCSSTTAHSYNNSDGRNRIYTSLTTSPASNWLSGFWGCAEGVAYHEGWITQSTYDSYTSGTVTDNNRVVTTVGNNWLLSTDCGYDSSKASDTSICTSKYRANGADQTAGTLNTATTVHNMGINIGGYYTESSKFQIAEILLYNRTLSFSEVRQVETYLSRAYGLPLMVGNKNNLGVYTNSVGSTYNSAFSTQPQINVRDMESNTVTTDTGTTVSASISPSTGAYAGQLIGDTTANTINGVATFGALGIKGSPGYTYTITYSASGAVIATETRTLSATVIPATVSISLSNSGNKRAATTITASTGQMGQVTFYSNGKAINRCSNVSTNNTYPFTATCNWTPMISGYQVVSALMAPSDSTGYSSSRTSGTSILINKRAISR